MRDKHEAKESSKFVIPFNPFNQTYSTPSTFLNDDDQQHVGKKREKKAFFGDQFYI